MRAPTTPAARFAAASAVGGLAAMVVLTSFVVGTGGLFDREPLSGLYEAQARSLLHGRWDVPPEPLSFERFAIDGRYYMYFGPWPALLRLPVVLLTDGLDGRLARVSMLLASAVLLAAVGRLSWQVRGLRRAGDVGRGELLIAAAVVFVAGCGTTTVFVSAWTAVYHEAIQWGVAWSLVSTSFLLAHLTGARRRDLVLATAAATFAVLSRSSVGLGPVAALGLLLLVRLAGALRRRDGGGRVAPAAIALAVPVLLLGWVNVAKFGSPFGVPPLDKQDLLRDWPTRGPALAANGGSLFGPGYAPTILLQYLRPDTIRLDRLFPWVGFSGPPRVVGGAVFEALNPSAGIPAASPLAAVLAGVGAWVVASRRRVLAVPLLGAAVGCVGALSLGFLDQRYQADFLPLLLLAALAGAWWVAASAPSPSRWAGRGVLGVVVLAGAWSCWANGSLAYVYQHGYAPFATTSDRVALVGTQLAGHDALADGPPSRVLRGAGPPAAPAPPWSLYVEGRCDALHWTDGRAWYPVEETPATGRFRLRVDLGRLGDRALLRTSDASGAGTVRLVPAGAGRVRAVYAWRPAGGGQEVRRRGGAVEAGRTAVVEVRLDGRGVFVQEVAVEVDGRRSLAAGAPLTSASPEVSPAATALPVPTPLCDRLR